MADEDLAFEAIDALEEAADQLEQQAAATMNPKGDWKPKPLMAGNRELPERIKVYNKLGEPSMVPTASISYHLNKKDPQGNKVFFRKPPMGVAVPEPDPTLTCEPCQKRDIHKRFFNEIDWEAHWDTYHPREWAIRQRQEQRAREDRLAADTLRNALQSMTPAERKALIGGS